MIIVEIDSAKDKTGCFIASSEGQVLTDFLNVSDNKDGFDALP